MGGRPPLNEKPRWAEVPLSMRNLVGRKSPLSMSNPDPVKGRFEWGPGRAAGSPTGARGWRHLACPSRRRSRKESLSQFWLLHLVSSSSTASIILTPCYWLHSWRGLIDFCCALEFVATAEARLQPRNALSSSAGKHRSEAPRGASWSATSSHVRYLSGRAGQPALLPAGPQVLRALKPSLDKPR